MTGREPSEGEEPEDRRVRASGFVTIVARSWRWYRGNAGPLIALFASVGAITVVAQVPLFAYEGDPPFTLSFMLGVLFPAVLYGYAYAVTAHMLQRDAEGDPLRARTAVREVRMHMRAIVNAAVIGSVLTAINPLGPLLPAFFYGPPILMQVVAVERRQIPDAWARVKEIMEGTWGRVILYLVSLSLALGALIQTVFGLLVVALDDLAEDVETSILLVSLALFMAFALPYLASAQFELYNDVRGAGSPPLPEDPTPD